MCYSRASPATPPAPAPSRATEKRVYDPVECMHSQALLNTYEERRGGEGRGGEGRGGEGRGGEGRGGEVRGGEGRGGEGMR